MVEPELALGQDDEPSCLGRSHRRSLRNRWGRGAGARSSAHAEVDGLPMGNDVVVDQRSCDRIGTDEWMDHERLDCQVAGTLRDGPYRKPLIGLDGPDEGKLRLRDDADRSRADAIAVDSAADLDDVVVCQSFDGSRVGDVERGQEWAPGLECLD